MGVTTIAWADKTVNPYTWNCDKISEGCKFCYAEALAERFKGGHFAGAPQWRNGVSRDFKKLKSGDVVFINSISDTFHEGVPFRMIHDLFMLVASRPDVQFLILTKRIERAWYMRHLLPWTNNLWMGTSVELRKYLWRIEYLLDIPSAGHFVSIEPLLESIVNTPLRTSKYDGIEDFLYVELKQPSILTPFRAGPHKARYRQARLDWVIVGAESGVNRRPFDKQWAREICDACVKAGIPFMFKQGSAVKSGQDTFLDGKEWMQIPEFQLSSSIPAHGTESASVQMTMFT